MSEKGVMDSTKYFQAIWRTDALAAYAEAQRRITQIIKDPTITSLFLADLESLKDMPEEIKQCQHLTHLFLNYFEGDDFFQGIDSGTRNFSFVKALNSWQWLSSLNSLVVLYVSCTNISNLSALSDLSSLQTLDCSFTKVSDLSALSGLSHLQRLDCSITQVSNLSGLADLSNLQTLHCSSTQVSDLSALSGLSSLQTLFCSHTLVSDLSALSGLSSLQALDCSWTQVSDLSALSGLSGLQTLGCSVTKVSDLSALSGLLSLQTLDCSHTLVSDLSGLSDLPNLKELYAYDLTITGLPDGILSETSIDNCLARLLAHWEDLGEQPTTLNAIKLVVLGNGRIGKTQITNRLCNIKFEPDADSTHAISLRKTCTGISVNALNNSVETRGSDEGQTVYFNIWDFGGQDIYHNTHSLFLNSRAICLLVWTPETDNSEETECQGMMFRNRPVRWWLEFISRFAHNKSPLIAVQNQLDVSSDCGDHDAVKEVRNKPFDFVRSVAMSAKNDEGLDVLQLYLKQAVKTFNLPLIGRGRMAVIEKIEGLQQQNQQEMDDSSKKRLLTYQEFVEFCEASNGVSNPKQFLSFLHNAGIVFWKEGLFENQIILDQAWVLQGVYTIFDRDHCVAEIRETNGRFTREKLQNLVWGRTAHEGGGYNKEEQELFLSFMQACGICFPLNHWQSSGSTVYIAPDLLPETHFLYNTHKQAIKGGEHRQWSFSYLPSVLLRNVMSRFGKRAGEGCSFWRHGFAGFHDKSGCHILVEQHIEGDGSGHVDVYLSEGNIAMLLASVTGIFNEECQKLGLEPVEQNTRGDNQQAATAEDAPVLNNAPNQPKKYYVSYAWNSKDNSDRETIVDDFCDVAEKNGITILRDKHQIEFGQSISQFMQQLVEGDKVFICLSDKYLKSENCMTELYHIWVISRANEEQFRERVWLYTQKDANIWERVGRAKYAKYWQDKYNEEKELLEHMADKDKGAHHKIGYFYSHVADILWTIADTLQARNLDDLTNYAFDNL